MTYPESSGLEAWCALSVGCVCGFKFKFKCSELHRLNMLSASRPFVALRFRLQGLQEDADCRFCYTLGFFTSCQVLPPLAAVQANCLPGDKN
jgi:hypothetical protein